MNGNIMLRTGTLCLVCFLAACASAPENPNPIPEGDFTERLQTQSAEGISVIVGVPSASETRELFGQDLYRRNIQPVWLEIDNSSDDIMTFLPVGLDPAYFSPQEVAHIGGDGEQVRFADESHLKRGMALRILPGESREGFLFTKLDEGTKSFNVDVTTESGFHTFTFFVPVPGLAIDHYNIDWDNMYAEDEWVDLDDEDMMRLIESFQCCVTDKDGENTGDPLNLVIIGEPLDVYTAFIRAGWDETEIVTKASSWKTIQSFFSGGEYRYSPISSLYVWGRPQDIAFQKARDNIHERNHLRLWMSRGRYQGYPVWIGQISRDIGVRFTKKTITTHKIDPNVDETRAYLLEDLAYAQSLARWGYVGGVGEVSQDEPKGNLTGDPWFTDGYRIVLWVTREPTALSDMEYLKWRNPYDD